MNIKQKASLLALLSSTVAIGGCDLFGSKSDKAILLAQQALAKAELIEKSP
ncbi:hypothetical protein [Candidatus Liberibacter brunswickensis]|uniref:hypothetical protein n=1 Tax=Candidatus Liberibacter brunswickensis TaxID=1968796 RepID=UPI002FE30736